MFVMVNSERCSGNKAIKSLSFESDSIVFLGGNMLLKQATIVPLLVVVISADESHCNINVLFQYSIVRCCSIHHNA